MGSNSHGQLGDGTTTDRSTPIKVEDNVTIISADSEHSMYVKKDGSLWVMGRNWYGELGTGKKTGMMEIGRTTIRSRRTLTNLNQLKSMTMSFPFQLEIFTVYMSKRMAACGLWD